MPEGALKQRPRKVVKRCSFRSERLEADASPAFTLERTAEKQQAFPLERGASILDQQLGAVVGNDGILISQAMLDGLNQDLRKLAR